jgi:hypothetical protein
LKGGNPRDVRLYAPIELFVRQLTVPGFPIGTEVFGASNLLTWSSVFKSRWNGLKRFVEKRDVMEYRRTSRGELAARDRNGCFKRPEFCRR